MADRRRPHPSESTRLVGSQRLRDFLASLTDHFDGIIIDTTPIMVVTDSSLVAHYASWVLFLVGADMTSRHAAKRPVEQLTQVNGAFLLGVVLHRADLEGNPCYYSQYYRAEYSSYYGTTTAAR